MESDYQSPQAYPNRTFSQWNAVMPSRFKSPWAALVCVVLGTVACQRAPDETKTVPRNVSFLHYFSFAGSFGSTMESVVADFNRRHPEHVLTATPLDHEAFKTSIRDDLRLGNTADVYSYWAGERVQSIADTFAPIDDVLPADEMNKLFSAPVVRSACTYNGRIRLLPLTQHYVGFFYNKQIFAENKLSPPKTWDEFITLNETLRARGIVPLALGSKARWPAQFWFDYLLLRSAPLDYRQRLMAGKASFNDPEVVRAFGLWNDLIQRGFFNPHPNELDFDTGAALMVRRGEAAMTLMGTWLIGYFNDPAVVWTEENGYGFFPFPSIDPKIPPVALGPIDGLVVPQAARNSAGAKALIRFFAEAGVQATISRGTGALAPNLDVEAEKIYSPLKMEVGAEVARSSAWAFNYDLATPPERAEVGLDLFAEFLEFPDQYKYLLDTAESRMATIDGGSAKTPE